jgi:hypothetical protein
MFWRGVPESRDTLLGRGRCCGKAGASWAADGSSAVDTLLDGTSRELLLSACGHADDLLPPAVDQYPSTDWTRELSQNGLFNLIFLLRTKRGDHGG